MCLQNLPNFITIVVFRTKLSVSAVRHTNCLLNSKSLKYRALLWLMLKNKKELSTSHIRRCEFQGQ